VESPITPSREVGACFVFFPFFAAGECFLGETVRFFATDFAFFAGLRVADFFAALGAFFLCDLAIKWFVPPWSGGKRRLN
jgi:hypothetical protein